MEFDGNDERTHRSYAMAFKVGFVGSIILALFALVGDRMAGLVALAIWSLIILFVLPWFYIVYLDIRAKIPNWALRGPHQ